MLLPENPIGDSAFVSALQIAYQLRDFKETGTKP
jgi:hypothetical protein